MGPGLFRFFLAALVVIGHTSQMTLGTVAVFSFFILSGYCITLAWERKYSRLSFAPFVFFGSRLWRLYPAFAASVVFAAYMAGTPLAPQDLSLFGAISNAINPPVWSLDVEAQFYLLVPLLVPVLRGRIEATYALSAAVVLFVLYGVATWLPTLLPFLIFFVIGALAARFRWRVPAGLAVASAILVIAALALSYMNASTRYIFFSNVSVFRHLQWASAAVAIAASPLVIWTAQRRGGRFDDLLGRLSYTLYLIHWPLVHSSDLIYANVYFLGFGVREFAFEYGPKPAAYLLTMAGALVLYVFEAPFEWARRIVVYGQPARIPSSALWHRFKGQSAPASGLW
jgi:peptidoglycan/LPS O-acetylase OafA/YrhL